jgi:hypothetical protein
MPTIPMFVSTTSKVPGRNTSMAAAPLETAITSCPPSFSISVRMARTCASLSTTRMRPRRLPGVSASSAASADDATATGSRIVNVVPRPRRLSTRISPL